MVKKIAIFNSKGGVGKTTTTFNLGCILAEKGKRVILADTDSQCDLTETALNDKIIENIYKTNSNIKAGLAPAFESQPKAIEAIDCIPIEGRDGLFLLPGHAGFAEYEATLAIAQGLSESTQTLKNLPGSINYLFERTATKFKADYILIDMSPSLGAINQNLLMISDFFIVPTIASFGSIMALETLSKVLQKWYRWAKKASALPILQNANYPFPDVDLYFLGFIVLDHKTEQANQRNVQDKIKSLETTLSENFIPILRSNHMLLPQLIYREYEIEESLILTTIFIDSLMTLSSRLYHTPVYSLTPEQLNQTERTVEDSQRQQAEFKEIFSNLADKVIGLTSAYAASN